MCRCDCRAWKKMARIGCLDERAVCFRCGKGYPVRLRSGLAFRRQKTKKGESISILLRISFPVGCRPSSSRAVAARKSSSGSVRFSYPDYRIAETCDRIPVGYQDKRLSMQPEGEALQEHLFGRFVECRGRFVQQQNASGHGKTSWFYRCSFIPV